jgi:broad specificity phosphatase PhoE
MQVILLRHATRNTHELGDPPLNVTGQAQAQELVESLNTKARVPRPTLILSSPKKRARETLAPIAKSLGISVVIDDRLDERHQNESQKIFEARIYDFLASLTSREKSCILICSHFDWLETASLSLTNLIENGAENSAMSFGWATAEFKVFEFHDGKWAFGTTMKNAGV